MELDVTTEFTPWASLAGGILIGLSAVMVMGLFGRIAGIAGITSGLLLSSLPGAGGARDRDWRLGFVLGLVAAPLAVALAGGTVAQTVPQNLPAMAVAGLLVGVGVSLGSGCTSGHGVCGLARLSPRSLAATLVFMAAGIATVFVLRHLGGVV